MSDQATRFWLSVLVVLTAMLVSHALGPLIAARRFSSRRMFYLLTAACLLAAALAIKSAYWPHAGPF